MINVFYSYMGNDMIICFSGCGTQATRAGNIIITTSHLAFVLSIGVLSKLQPLVYLTSLQC